MFVGGTLQVREDEFWSSSCNNLNLTFFIKKHCNITTGCNWIFFYLFTSVLYWDIKYINTISPPPADLITGGNPALSNPLQCKFSVSLICLMSLHILFSLCEGLFMNPCTLIMHFCVRAASLHLCLPTKEYPVFHYGKVKFVWKLW